MNSSPRPSPLSKGSLVRRARGFTLIEIVLALGLMAALITMCARMASANLQLAQGISRNQAESTVREGFFEMMNQQFRQLPGNARVHLETTQGAQPYLYTLTLQNVPLAFTWGGVEKVAKAIQIAGVKRRDGYLNVVMRYYEHEILDENATNQLGVNAEEPFAEIILLEDLRFFEWRALDGRSLEWQLDWDVQGRAPLQLELVMAQGAYGDELKQIFWLVPKVNPETVMRTLGQQQQGQNPNNPNQPPATGGPILPPIQINPPPNKQ